MKSKNYRKSPFIFILPAIFIFAASIIAQTTAFNYQGKLTDAGSPANGTFQFQFKLFDAAAGGDQIGKTISDVELTAANGIFSTQLDFGTTAFSGENRFLEIAVRHNSGESYVTLSPREQIASSPYAVRTLSAAQADLSLDSNKLGGLEASEYVTTATIGGSFIRNNTTQQTGNFNVSGNGTLGGILQANEVRAQTGSGFYGLTQTDGAITVSTYVGGSSSGAVGGWFGTRSNSPLYFYTNGGQPNMTVLPNGNVGIGTATPTAKFEVNGNSIFTPGGSGGNIQLGTPLGETGMTISGTNRADIRFDGTTLKLLAGTGVGAMASTNGININRSGNVGLGTVTPNTRLTLFGGVPWTSNGWTASMNLQNGTAFGWEANASGQQFGIGQAGGGLYFFRTNSVFGNTAAAANYDLQITDTGNLTQPLNKNGMVKAAALVRVVRDCPIGGCQTLTPSIVNCYNSVNNSTTGNCGFTLPAVFSNGVDIDFGFQINNRFISLTPGVGGGSASISTFVGTNRLTVLNGNLATSEFYIFVF